nr:uncharacterized protein LOC105173793 [Ipomoea trifida]
MLQNLRNRACYLADAERQFFNQKLKLKSLIDGDKDTKYFHDLVKKSNRDKSITCIIDENEQPTTSLTQVGALFVDYFKSLFGVSCDRTPSYDIKVALFDIDDLKAPGPDGYSAAFFKKNWDIIGDDLVKVVQEFFVSGPISCCNMLYKVISKVLAGRLSSVLPSIIDHAQAAFVEGRSMSDNIFLAQELIRGAHHARLFLLSAFKNNKFHIWLFAGKSLGNLVWTRIRDIIGFQKKTIAIRSTIKWIHRLHKGSRRQDHGVAIALACSIYHIWRFRNLVVHEAGGFNLEGLMPLEDAKVLSSGQGMCYSFDHAALIILG